VAKPFGVVQVRDHHNSGGAGTAVLWGLVAGAAYGSVGVVAKLAFRDSLTTSTILAARLTLGAVAIWVLAAAFGAVARIPPRRTLRLVAIGAVCFYGQGLLVFLSVERIPATTMEFLLYSYPALVAVSSAILFGERLGSRGVIGLGASLVGLSLLLGSPGAAATSTGGAMALGAAVATTVYLLLLRVAGSGIHPLQVSATVLSGAAAGSWIGGLATGTIHAPARATDLLWLLLHAILIATAVSASVVALQKMGATKTAVTATFEPVTTAVLATLLLSERLTVLQGIGGVLVVAAAVVLALSRRRRPRPRSEPAPVPNVQAWEMTPAPEGEAQ
jgi:drug/metabolite transporter (DMT)-like permease